MPDVWHGSCVQREGEQDLQVGRGLPGARLRQRKLYGEGRLRHGVHRHSHRRGAAPLARGRLPDAAARPGELQRHRRHRPARPARVHGGVGGQVPRGPGDALQGAGRGDPQGRPRGEGRGREGARRREGEEVHARGLRREHLLDLLGQRAGLPRLSHLERPDARGHEWREADPRGGQHHLGGGAQGHGLSRGPARRGCRLLGGLRRDRGHRHLPLRGAHPHLPVRRLADRGPRRQAGLLGPQRLPGPRHGRRRPAPQLPSLLLPRQLHGADEKGAGGLHPHRPSRRR
mmetsp:Transcript_7879/g.25075  ORF Transcript_7879/g.25075 Transcript_7879/m.25075 type:complete len:287 (-) Transcript_7879:451-1311(-)